MRSPVAEGRKMIVIRRRFFPKEPLSIGAFCFIACVIPLVYWFEIFVVLPSLYEMWSPYYWMHLVCAHFLTFNVVGSYVGLLLIDNSVEKHARSQKYDLDWRHCTTCNIKVPPRSWHCASCDSCMLKRDHHCFFTGYCIGHHNHRLFIMFLFYILVSCVYGTFYNYYFFAKNVEFPKLLYRVFFSVPILLMKETVDSTQVYLLISYIIVGGTIFVLVLFIYHINLIVAGCVVYERNHNIVKYNLGIKRNLINIFGERWYLCWLSPFITSKLPTDGFHWDVHLVQTKQL